MENRKNRTEAKKRPKVTLPARKQIDTESMMGQGLVDYICSELGIVPQQVASLLSINEKTLLAWKNEVVSELETNTKPMRLVALYNVVVLARENKMNKHLIMSMLYEPVDPAAPEMGSILSHLVKDPKSDLFRAIAPKFVREYLSNHDLKRRVITLSDRDRDSFLAALENPPEPNEALKAIFKQGNKKSDK
jgi:Protein of unknown function (DUF1778)